MFTYFPLNFPCFPSSPAGGLKTLPACRRGGSGGGYSSLSLSLSLSLSVAVLCTGSSTCGSAADVPRAGACRCCVDTTHCADVMIRFIHSFIYSFEAEQPHPQAAVVAFAHIALWSVRHCLEPSVLQFIHEKVLWEVFNKSYFLYFVYLRIIYWIVFIRQYFTTVLYFVFHIHILYNSKIITFD